MNSTPVTGIPNYTTNQTTDSSSYCDALCIFYVVTNVIIFILGLAGNGLVIWIAGFKVKKSVIATWYLSLAVSDFIYCSTLPFSVVSVVKRQWIFGSFICKFGSFIFFLNIFSSVFLLTIISVDRCVVVMFPVWAQNQRSVKKASVIVMVAWIISAALSTPPLVFRDVHYTKYKLEDVSQCHYNDISEFIAGTTIVFVFSFVIPFPIIFICYVVIMRKLVMFPSAINSWLASVVSIASKLIDMERERQTWCRENLLQSMIHSRQRHKNTRSVELTELDKDKHTGDKGVILPYWNTVSTILLSSKLGGDPQENVSDTLLTLAPNITRPNIRPGISPTGRRVQHTMVDVEWNLELRIMKSKQEGEETESRAIINSTAETRTEYPDSPDYFAKNQTTTPTVKQTHLFVMHLSMSAGLGLPDSSRIMNSTPVTEPEFLLYSNHNTNQTMDSSSCDAKCIFYVVTNMIIFFLGVAGNGLVIWIAGFKVKKSVVTTWYLSLAVSDFIFCSTLLFNVVYMQRLPPRHHQCGPLCGGYVSCVGSEQADHEKGLCNSHDSLDCCSST
ncbi:hypothetical protein NFI96_007254 [Prochilodus magdalenae]|nr:hypothetical protein NFI96_007254 [Prochilodus magdalenae]